MIILEGAMSKTRFSFKLYSSVHFIEQLVWLIRLSTSTPYCCGIGKRQDSFPIMVYIRFMFIYGSHNGVHVLFANLCSLTYRYAFHQRCEGTQYSVDGRKFGELQHRVSLVTSLNLVIFSSPNFFYFGVTHCSEN